MLTALDSEADIVLGLEAGADDYVTKPFGLGELRSRIRAVMRRAHGRLLDEDVIQIGDVLLNRRDREVQLRGEPVKLTFSEYELLACLMSRPGHLFNRQELLRAIWGDSAYRDPRAIDVHIRHLREKLEERPGPARAHPHRPGRRIPRPGGLTAAAAAAGGAASACGHGCCSRSSRRGGDARRRRPRPPLPSAEPPRASGRAEPAHGGDHGAAAAQRRAAREPRTAQRRRPRARPRAVPPHGIAGDPHRRDADDRSRTRTTPAPARTARGTSSASWRRTRRSRARRGRATRGSRRC